MSFNLVANPVAKLLIKADVKSNFIFTKNNREQLRTVTFGVGAQSFKGTLLFLNRSKTTFFSNTSDGVPISFEPTITLNLRQQLKWKLFPPPSNTKQNNN